MSHPLIAPNKDYDEQTAFTGWRKYYIWKRGQLKRIKAWYWRRVRRQTRRELNGGV